MRFFTTLALCSVISWAAMAQRKMPNLTFQEHSTEYADANKKFDENNQFSDTLRDEHIVGSLAKILTSNPELQIELGGHCAMNEDTLLAIQRAEKVKMALVGKGIQNGRISVKSYGKELPIIKDETVLKMNSLIEREAANQRNRRVEVKVIGVDAE